MAVDFGVFVPQGWKMDLVGIEDPYEQYEAMTRVAQVADGTGAYDSIWVYDHFHTTPRPTRETTFEAWTISAGLSRDTERVKIGQMVTCNGYRNPALLAKMASTVDVMSNGRLLFGLGAGWYEHEWLAYGYGFPETKERLARLSDDLEVITRMLAGDRHEQASYDGEYAQVKNARNVPKPIQQPRVPIMVGFGTV